MRRSIITLSLTLVVLVAGAFFVVRARDDKPAQPPAQGAAQQAGAKYYSEGLSGVDFTGLDAAAKERALKLLNSNKCDCNCDMTIAQCRVEDKTCPRSPGLAAAVVNAIRAGKSDAEAVAALKPAAAGGADQPVQPVPKMEIATAGAPAKGKEGAKVTVVAFEDFQCPYCSRSAPVLQKILDTYPSDVRVVYKHFPLSFHKNAKPAAIASVAAQKQGKFWEMYEVLFKNQTALDDANLRKYAESVGLDMAAYDKAYADPATAKLVDQDTADASKVGVQGTPTMFVNGVQAPSWDFAVMQKLIEAAKSGGDVGQVAGQVRADMMAQMKANRPAPPDPNKVYEIDIAGAPVKGPANASVTLVEFSDYQCPYCASAEPLIKQVLDAYPTQAKLVYKHFPLSFHPNARPAAEAAMFAQKHGKFWEMHKLLFENSKTLTLDNMKSFAQQIGLDAKALEESVSKQAFKSAIDKDMSDGSKAGVSGTPSLFVNGKRVMNRDFANIKRMIDEALAAKGSEKASK